MAKIGLDTLLERFTGGEIVETGSQHGNCDHGLLGLGSAVAFMAVLLVALVYAWRKGVIGWG